ncbi:E3 ubiquitin-protein ligase TRIM33-like [Sycon ciliatum]|uniref:E3 ubiquitin-protein ligase TRIM33-like n=1 Tax=Sycon ciliatum TaxID=27933 RepID=UPI0031F6BD21
MSTAQCYGCGSSNTTLNRLKYISCLHTLCVPCVQNSIDFDGSIKCPQCFSSTQLPVGMEPLRSLPSVVLHGNLELSVAGNDESQAISACEECGDDTAATSSCENCHVRMCEAHAGVHSLNKGTKGHIVKPLIRIATSSSTMSSCAGSTGRPRGQRNPQCAVHSNEKLDRFCVQCNQILCPRCKLAPSHKHDHQVLDIPSAGQMSRDKLSEKLASCTSESDGVINKVMRNVSRNIEALNEQTECASAKVTDVIKEQVEILKKRESDLFAELDAMRSKKLIPLEKQLNRLQECVAQVESAGLILQSGSDDVDLLRMFSWIDGTLDKAMKTTEVEGEPCTADSLWIMTTVPSLDTTRERVPRKPFKM